jgi:hypothetical protein
MDKGPFEVDERSGDHYYVTRRGERMLVNPGRLRKYHLWTEDPWEDEDYTEPPQEMDEGHPSVGDLVAIGLTLDKNSTRPFAIGKILKISDQGIHDVHWFGNRDRNIEGTYRPEWRNAKGAAGIHIHYDENAREEPGAYKFTSVFAKMAVKRRDILHFGFNLLYNERLPPTLLRKLHANKDLNWKIPKPRPKD